MEATTAPGRTCSQPALKRPALGSPGLDSDTLTAPSVVGLSESMVTAGALTVKRVELFLHRGKNGVLIKTHRLERACRYTLLHACYGAYHMRPQ